MKTREKEFSNIVIVGVGLLGSSLGLALKKSPKPRHIIGVGRPNSPSNDIALKRNAVDEISTDLAAATINADLAILCTPVRQFPDALKILRQTLKPGAIVTDVGSTKSEVMNWAHEIFAGTNIEFVGSHPMAGSEKRGPEFARADLFEGAMCLLCGEEGNALDEVEKLWREVGMKTLRLGAQEHDRWVATVSHLPHAVAFSLMNAAAKHPEMLAAAAGGFIDTTRVASSDVDMWTDIFLTNRAGIVGAIEEFAADLANLKSAIEKGDEAAIRAVLVNAKRARDELIEKRKSVS